MPPRPSRRNDHVAVDRITGADIALVLDFVGRRLDFAGTGWRGFNGRTHDLHDPRAFVASVHMLSDYIVLPATGERREVFLCRARHGSVSRAHNGTRHNN